MEQKPRLPHAQAAERALADMNSGLTWYDHYKAKQALKGVHPDLRDAKRRELLEVEAYKQERAAREQQQKAQEKAHYDAEFDAFRRSPDYVAYRDRYFDQHGTSVSYTHLRAHQT
jgi:hypothetical protein